MNSTIFLFIATLLCWGPTWYIIKFQLGIVDPMVSVFYRFFLASIIILLFCIYKKINLPIKQIDKKENWKRIIDFKNNSGWIHTSQLKPISAVITLEDKILFNEPSNFSKPLAKIQKGRLLLIQKCSLKWCKIKSGKFKGWIKIDNIWGTTN